MMSALPIMSHRHGELEEDEEDEDEEHEMLSLTQISSRACAIKVFALRSKSGLESRNDPDVLYVESASS